MSRSRAAVLAAVESTTGPSSLAAVASATGLHVNTVREHLERLLADGLVRREAAAPNGRGRPASLYRPAHGAGSPATEYAGLAATLAAFIHRTSSDPVEDAVAAGTDWGHELARTAGRPEDATPEAARRQVVAVLDGMGFDPRTVEESDDQSDDQSDDPSGPATTLVRLTRCPLLDAAQRYPDVVCGVHLGIAKGALEEYGVDSTGTTLEPFAEPGACLLLLAAQGRDR